MTPAHGGGPLRVALLSYRGNPRSGGQGVYVRQLSRALSRLGHEVEVIAGPPYPDLDDAVRETRLPSLELYEEPDPFSFPGFGAFRDGIDVLEFVAMCTAAFPEPLTFSLRAWRHLRGRPADFDIVHDNQGLGYGLLGIRRLGLPVVATVHHPVTIDRRLELAHAGPLRRLTLRRWYAFTRMQRRVVARVPRVLTVSGAAAGDVADEFSLPASRVTVVPNGVDPEVFRPRARVGAVPGRIVTTASADVPLKGLVPLLEAVAKVRVEDREAHLVVVGSSRPGGLAERTLDRLDLRGAVRFVSDLTEDDLARLLCSASVAVVPSLYEGFSLPAIEAMACATPLVATTAGALPEVAGRDGDTALLVPPDDPGALAVGIGRMLGDERLRHRVGAAGRRRVLERFTWEASVRRTVDVYRDVLAGRR